MLASAFAQYCSCSCIRCLGYLDLSWASPLLDVPIRRHAEGSRSSFLYGLQTPCIKASRRSRVDRARLLMRDESLPDSTGSSRFPAQENLKWSGPRVDPKAGATPGTDRASDEQEEGPDERAAVSAFLRELELLDSPSFAAPPVRSPAKRADDGARSRSPISLPRSSRGLRKWAAASRPLFGKAEGLTTRAEKWVPARERRGELPRRLVRAAPLTPLRVMVFIDGSWLFCSLHERGRRCLIKQLYGHKWEKTYHIDFGALPQIISDRIASELLRSQSRFERPVEVVRTHVYSSLKPNPSEPGSIARKEMFDCMREQHFDVHLGDFTGPQEKCVDIALAVDMLHYATTPDAFDVAVLVSGDADFLPALVRTRQKGKRVAVCSMRNSAAADFESPECQIKDFDVIWLDDHLPQLVSPIPRALMRERPALVEWLRTELIEFVDRSGGGAQERQLRQHFSQLALGESADCNALAFLEHEFGGLRNFVLTFRDVRLLRSASAGGFRVSLGDEIDITDETDETGAARGAARRALRTRPVRRFSTRQATEEEGASSSRRADAAPPDSVQRAGDSSSDVGERTRDDAGAVARRSAGGAEGDQADDAAQDESAGGLSSFLLAAESCLFDGESDDRAGEAADAQAASGDLDDRPFEDQSLSNLTVPQLRAVLKGMELPVSGSKPALIRRVLQARSRYDKS